MSDLVQRAAAIAAEVAGACAHAVDRDARFPHESFAALKSARLLGAMVPRDFGGEQAGLADIAGACHALGRACGSTGLIYAMHQIQVACIVRHGQGSAWHRGLLERLAAEQLLLGSATTEAGVGGDVRRSVCALGTDGARFAIDKQASVISYGADADGILATARRAADAPPSDQVITVVMKDDARLVPSDGWDTLGMRGTCSVGYRLVGSGGLDQILPQPYAEISAQTMLPVTHILWSAVWLGIATEAVARARAFIRAAARKTPGTMPPGAVRLAETVAGLHQTRAGVADAIRQFEAAADADRLSSLSFAVAMNALKVNSATAAVRAVEGALLVCGLAGYRNDGPFSLGRLLRDAHSAALMINNDRILANSAGLLLVDKEDTGLFG
ncbi:acyl-CoA/acyl-ACP dehydrogenase [Azospirillum sp. RWY-5-1]|uniref:Acyl-CoA/acyl-ACP dehydrogenase n=1 Tax=Azospirillum oleiclasticum TaxID=2735135 RepID=A0ABX2T5Z3_9PROT|nr:acyl-CoA/acyl-ACP dehydrogenase [Azospirillum oleiclasticum]NYZ19755.1 acyl-CoA/acyl-ACP dehydrogenase [Azospirillum oleiclasticum]